MNSLDKITRLSLTMHSNPLSMNLRARIPQNPYTRRSRYRLHPLASVLHITYWPGSRDQPRISLRSYLSRSQQWYVCISLYWVNVQSRGAYSSCVSGKVGILHVGEPLTETATRSHNRNALYRQVRIVMKVKRTSYRSTKTKERDRVTRQKWW